MTTETVNVEDKKPKKVTLNRNEGAELNDEARVPKRTKREALRLLRVAGGKTRPGYVRRWVKDKRTSGYTGSNIEDKKFLGYTIVENEDRDIQTMTGKPMGGVVEKFEANGDRMVLMEIPIEEYEEIQAIKAEQIVQPKVLRGDGFDPNAHIDMKHQFE